MMSRIRRLSLVFLVVFVVVLAIGWHAHSKGLVALESPHASLDEHHANSSQPASQYTPTKPHKRTYYRRAPPTGYTLKIIAIGDLHGDYVNTKEVLKMAGVVDERGKWTGNIDYLIQTGDIIDRGTDTIVLFAYMDYLRSQAQAVGGNVVSLMGNHEYMNVQQNWDYVTGAELATFGPKETQEQIRWNILSSGFIGETWKRNYRVANRFPYHPSLGPLNTDYVEGGTSPLSHAALSFVHGGLSPTYPELTPFPSRINELGISALKKLQERELKQPVTLTVEENRLLDTNGPLWYRDWAQNEDEEVCAEVDAVLEKTGTRRMIMGHTAQLNFDGILWRCGGKIIVIDTGISSVFEKKGGMASALHIEYTLMPKAESISNGDQQVQWVEQEVITALYGGNTKEKIVNTRREVTGSFYH